MDKKDIFDLQAPELLIRALRGSKMRVLPDEKERNPVSIYVSDEMKEILRDYSKTTGFSMTIVGNLLLWSGVQLVTAQMEAIEAMEEEEFAAIDEMNAHQEGKKC